jgi:UDP-GlcNAc:undecaprenyl-phosphate GlcNAc-1-phosphate transferase
VNDLRDPVAVVIAFVACLVLLRGLVPIAHRAGLVDRPSRIKVHGSTTPLVGGLAIFCAFAMALPLLNVDLIPFRALLAAGAMLVVTGVLDGLHELSSRVRFGAQMSAALVMCFLGDLRLVDMGSLHFDGGMTTLGPLEVPLTVFCVVGVVNALNMADGLDGLGAGLAAVTLGALATAAGLAGHNESLWVLLVATSAVVAFWSINTRLPWRHRPAVAFMGDAGSLFLGFFIAWFVVALSQGNSRAIAPVQALWLLAIPLMGTVRLLVWRLCMGRSPFSGDQEHLHHVLRRLGLSTGHSVAVVLVLALAGAAFGLAGPTLGVSEIGLFLTFMACFCTYALFLGFGWWRGRLFVWPLRPVLHHDGLIDHERCDRIDRRPG